MKETFHSASNDMDTICIKMINKYNDYFFEEVGALMKHKKENRALWAPWKITKVFSKSTPSQHDL